MKKLEKIACIASITLIAWLIISFVDVTMYQTCGGTDAPWNIFNIILNLSK